jgi:cell division protein FtsI (penicillin-binding protein 3)
MNPPPGPGSPSVDHPPKSAPWNTPEYLPRGRRRVASQTRPPRHAVGRGTAASGSSSAPRHARAAERVGQPGQRSAPMSTSGRSTTGYGDGVGDRPAARHSSQNPRDVQSIFASTIASGVSSLRGVFDPSASGKGSKPVMVRTTVGNQRRRTLMVLIVIAVLFVYVLGHVINLQVLDRDKYVAYGAGQRTNNQVLAADRGAILDRNGAELVISRPGQSIFVDPKLVTDAAAEAAILAPVLGLDPLFVESKMNGKGRFAYLARRVPADVVERVEALGLAGVSFLDESERFAPAGESARSLLGSVDVDNVGISGLESQYGEALTGTPGKLSLERSPSGRTIAVGDHSLTAAVKGDDLKLTIDQSIQFEAERLLGEQVKTTGAKGGIAIVSKPGTGEILAIADMVLDPETGNVRPSSNNSALTTQYEPGSVMKVVTIAGAMDAGQISPTTQFNLPPTMRIYDAEFGEAEGRGTVTWDTSQILTHSSNIGTIKIGQGLGKDALYESQKAFGLGVKTSLNFPNETAGSVLAPSKYSGTSLPSIAIGQGISVTPMQMLFAYNTLANQGMYVAPKLVDSTIDANGVEHPTAAGDSHRAVSVETANSLNLMMRNVVNEGTGKLAAINGYSVAGKTGTARKPQPGGGYTDKFGITRYQSTFVGFVPAQQPALSIYVMIDEPSGVYTGGATAGPVFSKLGAFSLNRLGIAPPATDISLGGVPVTNELAPTSSSTRVIVTEGDRVRALTAGSPEALASTVPTKVVPPKTTATTTPRQPAAVR